MQKEETKIWLHFLSCWLHFGVVLWWVWGPFWELLGSILEAFWVHLGSFRWPFWGSGAAFPKSFQDQCFLEAFWAHLGAKMGQAGGKMTLRWPTWRQKWSQDGQLEAQDGQLEALWGAILAYLGHLGANFNEHGEKAKNL